MTGDYDSWDFDESECPFTDDPAPAGSKLACWTANGPGWTPT